MKNEIPNLENVVLVHYSGIGRKQAPVRRYLREVQRADEKLLEHFTLKIEIGIFKGDKESLVTDRNYWLKEGVHRVSYYELKEYKF